MILFSKQKRGTIIKYIPDPQFFTHAEVNMDELRKLFKEISALCPFLTIELNIDDLADCANKKRDLIEKLLEDAELDFAEIDYF